MTEEFLNAFRSKFGSGTTSRNWKHWVTQIDLKTCKPCNKMNGKIYPMRELLSVRPPLHPFCRCKIKPMQALVAGYASQDGTDGADYWVKMHGRLPDEYITADYAKSLGWIPKDGNLSEVAPGSIIGGDIFQNRNRHLPEAPGRQWYEADINYSGGFRGDYRLVYSNDGLIFASYDHYRTFVEIV